MPYEEFGIDELLAQGIDVATEIELELAPAGVPAPRRRAAPSCPRRFPLWLADQLRANGIEVERRPRASSTSAGARRTRPSSPGSAAPSTRPRPAMDAARELLRRGRAPDGGLVLDGEPLTVRADQGRGRAGVHRRTAPSQTSSSSRTARRPASATTWAPARSAPGEPIVRRPLPARPRVGLLRRHDADVRRRRAAGRGRRVAPARARRRSTARSAAIEPGVDRPRALRHRLRHLRGAGYPTQRTKEPGKVLEDGFFHGLGHGVGLEVHEEPEARARARRPLVAGDVVTVEPGLYRHGLRRLPARGPRARHRERRREPDGLPVRPRA